MGDLTQLQVALKGQLLKGGSVDVLHKCIVERVLPHGDLEEICVQRFKSVPPARNSYSTELPQDTASHPMALVGRRKGEKLGIPWGK